MLDALQFLILVGLFAAVIWFTVIKVPDKKEEIPAKEPAPRPPSLGPVGLYCSVCREFAGVVSHAEYAWRLGSGARTYCERCFVVTIEEYERQQAMPCERKGR